MVKNKVKKIINFILIIALPSTLYADFKLMGGLNLSKYNISPEEEYVHWNFKRGFSAGFGLEKNLTHNIILEFNFLFFQKGSKVEYADIPDLSTHYSLNVFSIPVLLRSKFLYGSSPYVVGGVELSSIISHKVKFEGEGEDAVDIKENTKNIDYGIVFGCGYEIEMQEHLYFFVEARCHLGLANIISNPVEKQSMKTNAILLLIGFRS